MGGKDLLPTSLPGGIGGRSCPSVTPEPNEVQPMKHRMISAWAYLLSFLNLGPCIFQRHGSVKEEGLR